MRYSVLIEWDSEVRKFQWDIWLKDKPNVKSDGRVWSNASGWARSVRSARSKVSVALQQLKAEHEEDLRNAGKRIEFEGEL